MISRIARRVLYTLAGLVAVSLVLAGAILGRLAAGPISLSWLTPTIERQINDAQTSARVQIEDSLLTWRIGTQGPRLSLTGIAANTKDGTELARISELAVAISLRGLLQGSAAPGAINIVGLRSSLTIGKAGHIEGWIDEGASAPSVPLSTLSILATTTDDPANPLSFLSEIGLTDSQLEIDDRRMERRWRLSVPKATVYRGNGGVQGNGRASISVDDESTELSVVGSFQPEVEMGWVDIRLQDLRPSLLARLIPPLAPLAAMDLPLSGSLRAQLGPDAMPRELAFDILGGSGVLRLPRELLTGLDLNRVNESLAVQDVRLRGTATLSDDVYYLDTLRIAFSPNQALSLPPILDQRLPLRTIDARGRMVGNQLVLESLVVDLVGPRLTGEAVLNDIRSSINGTIGLNIRDVPTDRVGDYWPSGVAATSRAWVLQHLSGGTLREARITLGLTSDAQGADVTSLDGEFRGEQMTVSYLPYMPPAQASSVDARLTLQTLVVNVHNGQSAGISVPTATVLLTGLDAPIPMAEVTLRLDGPAANVVSLLDRVPGGLTAGLPFSPRQMSGQVNGDLRFRFPATDTVREDQFDFTAQVRLAGLGIDQVFEDLSVTNGNLSLDADMTGLTIAGSVALAGMQGRISWRENFAPSAAVRRTGSVSDMRFAVAEIVQRQPDWAWLETYLPGGYSTLRLDYLEQANGAARFDAAFDLRETRVAIPPLGWLKHAGDPATAFVAGEAFRGSLTALSRFALDSLDLDVAGSAQFDQSSQLRSVLLKQFVYGKSNLEGKLEKTDDNAWSVSISGSSLDVTPLLDSAGSANPAGGDTDLTDVDAVLSAQIDRIWLRNAVAAERLAIAATLSGGLITDLLTTANSPNGSSLGIRIEPDARGRRRLDVYAEDAGDAFRGMQFLTEIVGGKLTIKGKFDDASPAHPLSGDVTMHNFTLVRAPLLARILSFLALTDIVDALNGSGIAFRTLRIPFVYRTQQIEVEDVQAFGSALGLTAAGSIDLAAGTLDLNGTIIPFYWLNSAMGRLPLIGPLFTGGVPGGGVFSATFTATGDTADPRIDVSPFSVLFPGFIRYLLETLANWLGVAPRGVEPRPLAP